MPEEDNREGKGRWACVKCSYAYDPALGDPEHGVPAGTAFVDLPDTWCCPWCGAEKGTFIPEEQMLRDLQENGR